MKFLHQLTTEPWFISPDEHAALLAQQTALFALAAPATAPVDVSKALAAAFKQRPEATIEKDTGIAHIHLFGAVARNLAPLQRATGMTDFEQLHQDFAGATASGARGILLHVDSGGGTVNGTPEAAALVAKSPIPVVVHAERAGSAAYYIAAGATKIIASPSAEVGSIGVVMPRVDMSEALKTAGVKSDFITNTGGDLKAINPATPLTPAQREHLQAQADTMFAAFRAHVTDHRAIPATAMRGQTLSGSAALAASLVDGLGTAADARAVLLQRIATN
jgi:ClpP class serine protease